MKSQIPNSKFQISNKFQYITSNEAHLVLGIWNLELIATKGSDVWLG